MNSLWVRFAARWLSRLAPWGVLAGGLGATAWFTLAAHREMAWRNGERFDHEVKELVTRLETRLRTYGQALMGLRDWYAAQPAMTEWIWTNHIYSVQPPAHYPGLLEMGFVEFVIDPNAPNSYDNRDRHLAKMRERFPNYRLHLPPGGREGHSWYHMPVIWHSYNRWRRDPLREFGHYGMDLNQNPDLWAAMNWALGQDVPALSGKCQIDPDNPLLNGIMMFMPAYAKRWDHNEPITLNDFDQRLTPQQQEEMKNWRRHTHSLLGLIFGSIDINAFLKSDLGTNAPPVTFALYALQSQTESPSPERLLFDNRAAPGGGLGEADGGNISVASTPNFTGMRQLGRQGPALEAVRDLALYGRILRFVATPGPAFESVVNRRTLASAAAFGVTTTLLLAGFISYQGRSNRKERQISAALRQSETRLQVALTERERISRDLHDGTIQSLYAVGLGLGRVRRALHDGEARRLLEANLAELDHVVAELRGYLVVLDPGVSPVQSAAEALTELVGRIQQSTDTELCFGAEHRGIGEGWLPAAVLDLLLAAREGISNALRHGHATKVELALEQGRHGNVHLRIQDNGIGFDPSATPPVNGHGLDNLERRVRAWNGSLEVESRPGGPTCLTLTLSTFKVRAAAPREGGGKGEH